MLNVSDETKLIYQKDSIPKTLRIVFPNLYLEYHTEDIIMESFEWTESIFSGENIEFIGCIASMVKFDIVDRTGDIASINNELIKVYIKAGTTDEIPLFYGYVKSAVRTAQQYVKTVTAYDAFNQLADVDVTSWYTTHNQCTIGELLDDLLDYVGIDNQVEFMINSGVQAFCKNSKRTINSLSALNLLKAICQINGCCGKIDRYGRFNVVYLDTTMFNIPYPSMSLFPMDTLFPHTDELSTESTVSLMSVLDSTDDTSIGDTNDDDADLVSVSYYKSVTYEDYNVRSISKVTIRNKTDDVGVSSGTGDNNYIIQGNLFAYDQTQSTLKEMADIILQYNEKFEYTPFDSDNNGLPFLECGDGVIYNDIDYENNSSTLHASSQHEIPLTSDLVFSGGNGFMPQVVTYADTTPDTVERKFCILTRAVSGIQSLRDNFSAEGDKNQKTMVSDLGLQINDVDTQISTMNTQIAEISDGLLKAVSVSSVPSTWDKNTIYFLRK